MTQTELEGFQAQLFKALSGELTFEEVLDEKAADANAVSGVLFTLNRKTGAILDWTSPQLPFGDDAYSDHINSINPRMRYSMVHAPGHVVHEGRFTSEAAMAKSEFYDWLDRGFGLKHFLGLRLFDQGDISVFHSIEFGKSVDAPTPDQVTTFARKAKALGDAWKISKHIQPSTDPLQAEAFTPDHLPWAIFALNAQGEVLSLNAQAADEIRAGDVLTLGETLSASHKADRTTFRRAVLEAVSGGRAEVLVRSALSGTQYFVQFVSVPGHSNVAALVYLWNPAHRPENMKAVLMSLWKLSTQETELVLAITQTHTLKDASESLGIARNTGRNHLNSVFQKMSVNSQAEMLKRIFGLLG